MLGELFSGIVSLFNASQNRSAQEKFNEQQIQLGQQNMQLQKDFAQQGIRWRVEDAVQAGLHPLIGAGVKPEGFSPVSVGGSAPQMDLGSAGQDIGRAINAALTQEERAERVGREVGKLAIERGALENDLLRTELVSKVRRMADSVGPPFPGGRVPLPRSGPYRSASGEAVREDDLKQTIEDVPLPQSGRPFGFEMPYNKEFGSAQAFEDRYGDSELAQTLKFLVNMGADVGTLLYNSFPGRTGSAARRRRASRPWGE